MKEAFKWYFPPTEEEITKIWKEGILTTDTNVLLDLYRYNQNTREAILESLNEFMGRTWLSHQVGEEFFRNRNKVIYSAEVSFLDAEKLTIDIQNAIEEPLKKLRAIRIIPNEVGEGLKAAITAALETGKEELARVKDDYPDYRKEDPILESVCNLFDSRIGSPFAEEELNSELKEGKRRKENRIPPGFKDSDKEGDKQFGDYLMWRQILNYVKAEKKPLIFVTSEQKEDWWEKASGKTIGPLNELLREFHSETEQRLLLYRTDRFLEFARANKGKKPDVEAVEEILFVAHQRQKEVRVKVISQQVVQANPNRASGTLRVELLQEAFKFNVTGHFEPQLTEVPTTKVRLVSCPDPLSEFYLRSGAGTKFDFHIYFKSTEYNVRLPAGEYIFEYEAEVKSESSRYDSSIQSE